MEPIESGCDGPSRRVAAVVGAGALVALAAAAAIVLLPWIVGFAAAVAAAGVWCRWLDPDAGLAGDRGAESLAGQWRADTNAARVVTYPARIGSQPTVH